jgi:hypothetical protein
LKQQLEDKFPGQLEVTGEATPNTSGWLEVSLKGVVLKLLRMCFQVQVVGGALLHSKKGGDGYVDNAAKLEKIFSGVEAALK